jgi:hypothetical protein
VNISQQEVIAHQKLLAILSMQHRYAEDTEGGAALDSSDFSYDDK